jgi:hypothetical protein
MRATHWHQQTQLFTLLACCCHLLLTTHKALRKSSLHALRAQQHGTTLPKLKLSKLQKTGC